MSIETPVLIADDHPLMRQGLRQTIEVNLAFRIVAEASDGQQALDLIEKLLPPIAVLDVDMPHLDGFAVARAVRQRELDIRLIFLTVHREESYLQQAMSLNINGYVLKDSAITDIIASLEAARAGKIYVSPLMAEYLHKPKNLPGSNDERQQLTSAERNVLQLIAAYKSTREIAEALHISPHTVETHRKNICRKLKLRGSHALIKYALSHQAALMCE